jgi:cytosine/adenosine deaminase-related metal-dependent hydrolase
MIKQVFSNAIILEGENLEITHGYLVIRDGIIEEIGEGTPLRRGINLKRGFVLPPFVNAHTHIADSVMKELYLGRKQSETVGPNGVKFLALHSSPRDELLASINSTLSDMLRTGTLAHCDFRQGGVEGVKLIKRVSHSAVISIVLGRPSEVRELDEILTLSDGIGLPSLEVFDNKKLVSVANRTKRAKKLFSVHIAETLEAQSDSFRKFGKGEVERALGLNPSFIVHATYANKSDLEALRKKNIPVVFCPRANSLLGVGSPPIQLALETGTTFYFGTDNVTVCQPNMLEELPFAWSCLRKTNTSVGGDEARELLKAATVRPLEIFDLPWGPLEGGGKATFILLARGNNLINLADVYAGLVNRARVDNIRAICIRGEMIIS